MHIAVGVGHSNNTSLHLAEYRAELPGRKHEELGAPVLVDGERQWVTFPDIAIDDTDFEAIGKAFAEETGLVHLGKVAQADALLMPQRRLVDFAVRRMEQNRSTARS